MGTNNGANSHPRVILYDHDCGLCSRWVRFVTSRDRDHRFRFASVYRPYAQAVLHAHGMSTTTFDTLVYVENGRAYFRADAIIRVLRQLPGAWRVTALLHLAPERLLDALYGVIARNRYGIFGRAQACAYDGIDRRRFVD